MAMRADRGDAWGYAALAGLFLASALLAWGLWKLQDPLTARHLDCRLRGPAPADHLYCRRCGQAAPSSAMACPACGSTAFGMHPPQHAAEGAPTR
jgi:hypothetical protein